MFDKMTPAPARPTPVMTSQPAQNAAPLNLDLDLDLSLSKPASISATSSEAKNQNEQGALALDFKPETASQDAAPKTAPKMAAAPLQKVTVPSAPPPSTTASKGGAVFATPTIAR